MKYFSGETPRRGDVVQRVAGCNNSNNQDFHQWTFGDLALVDEWEEGLGWYIADGYESSEFYSDLSKWQLISRGNL